MEGNDEPCTAMTLVCNIIHVDKRRLTYPKGNCCASKLKFT